MLQIIANNTNLKANLERIQDFKQQRSWHKITAAEIGAFLGILLYISYTFVPRTRDYWNIEPNRAVYSLIINCMSAARWHQIKRFLKISAPIVNQKLDTRGPDWWKKLEPLATEFRIASKKWWIPGSHVSVHEQLVKFKGRSCHIMQIASKAAGVGFKLYSLCQDNYLYDFLFTFKVRSRISRIWAQMTDFSLSGPKSAS